MPIIGCFPQGGGEPGATSGGKRICRYVVGSSTAGWTAEECDYLCDGTADEVEINTALAALPAGGGEVHLLDGTYHLAGSVNVQGGAVKLTGCGKSTLLQAVQGSVATNLFELSCTSFHLAEMAVHITYDQAVGVLISNDVAFLNGTSAVAEIKMTGCEVDNILTYYVKAPTSAKFVMEDCRSLSSNPLKKIQLTSACESTFLNNFFDHGLSLQNKSTVANCRFDILNTQNIPAIEVGYYVPCVITGNQIYAIQGIDAQGLGLIANNRIILKKGSATSYKRIGIMSYWNGDLIEGNVVTRESGSDAFSTSEYTIKVDTDVTGTAVIGNMLYDKDVTDNGTGTVKANNVVLADL